MARNSPFASPPTEAMKTFFEFSFCFTGSGGGRRRQSARERKRLVHRCRADTHCHPNATSSFTARTGGASSC